MATVDARPDIVTAANWCVANKALFHYAEVRPFLLYRPTFTRPIVNDCSATFTLCYWLSDVIDDPNGPTFNYDGYGNTDSLVANGREVASGAATSPGDAVIYYSGGATVHVALIIEPGTDPLTMSHGSSTEPGFIRVSQDGRAHRFFTFNTQKPAPPTPPPTEDEMVVLAKNPHNGGTAILDLATGRYYGLSNPSVLAFYESCGVKHSPDPTAAVWDKFTQAGTI